MMRHLGKQILTIAHPRTGRDAGLVRALVAFVMLTFCVLSAPSALASDEGEGHYIVTDPLTGVAIGGYDPVAYFTEGEALPGIPEYSLEWAGVPWFFVSAANRDAFRIAPIAYAPVFGGYGSMGVARGFLSAGNPRIYALIADHLFLFYSTDNREAFLLAPKTAFEKAHANWPVLSQSLVQNN